MHDTKAARHALLASLLLAMTALAGCGNDTPTPAEAPEATPDARDPGPDAAGPPLADTRHGKVRGTVEDGIVTFKGVPYGADTATTRFAAPDDPQPWSDVRETTAFGATCPQSRGGNPGGLFSSWRPDPEPPMSEDCLFLNVWTPALDDGARPVMVWFHGGGFSTGNGSSNAYDGVRLAERGDVVVVTVNHRLNIFGYANLAHYGEGFADSPIAGVLDMIQALEWVRDNIAGFGGDPDTVMIFGESGGGSKVATLMSTDAAKGLFHRAVSQSSAFIQFPAAADAQAAADRMLANLEVTAENLEALRTLPVEQIQQAAAGTGVGSAPSLDGRVLTHHPFEPEAAPAGRDVPFMLGTNRTENSLFLAANPDLFDLTWEGLETALGEAYPDADVKAVIAGYRELQPESDPTDVYLEATTDARYLRGHVVEAERKAAQGGAPVYLYLFDWDTPVDGGKWRSPHALEIGFVFDNVAKSASMSGTGEAQQHIADIMADTWIAFARNGNPNNPRLPQWQPYDLETRPVMVFDETPAVVNDARAAQRALLDDSQSYLNRYDRYAPGE